nr:MAG TPA: hypothetical protein [Caudoviricetes sp.]
MHECYLATRSHSLVAFLCTKKDHSFLLSSLKIYIRLPSQSNTYLTILGC